MCVHVNVHVLAQVHELKCCCVSVHAFLCLCGLQHHEWSVDTTVFLVNVSQQGTMYMYTYNVMHVLHSTHASSKQTQYVGRNTVFHTKRVENSFLKFL